MKLLLKGGRVVDPADGLDGAFDVLIEDGRIARVGRDLPVDGARGRSTCRAAAGRRPGSSTCTSTCASRARSTRRRSPPARRRRWPAASPPSPACRTPTRSTTTPASPSSSSRRRREAGLARVYPIGAVSLGLEGRAARRASASCSAAGCVAVHRRRPAGGDGAADAARARVRRHVRHAGHRALRGPVAQGRRRRARGLPRPSALGLRGHSRRGRGDHGRARHLARRADRRPRPRRAHERAAVAASGARGQGARRAGHLRGRAAPLHAHRRTLGGAGAVRHQRQDEPAAARGARSRRDARRASPTAASTRSPPTTRRITPTRRSVEFDRAPFGIVGLETAVPICLDRLVHAGRITLSRLVELLSVNPARDPRRARRLAGGGRAGRHHHARARPAARPSRPARCARGRRTRRSTAGAPRRGRRDHRRRPGRLSAAAVMTPRPAHGSRRVARRLAACR